MLDETSILQKHEQSLREARDHCRWLGLQIDPDQAAPRGERYAKLRKAVQELEGTCRQMHYYREDARWLRLGILYAKTLRLIQAKYVGQRWKAFTELAPLFVNGLRQMDDLAQRRTGASGPILPKRPSDWLIMPDHAIPSPRSRMLLQ